MTRPLAQILLDPAFARSRSPTTLHNYTVALERWARFAGVVTADDATPERVRAFVNARLARVSSETTATEFHACMAVLDHEERAGRFDPELLRQLRRLAPELPRRKQLSAAFLTAAQVERAIAVAPHERARLALRLLTLTGLRASEACGLEWRDVDLAGRTLRVLAGKTGPRAVPLSAAAVEVLSAARPANGKGHVLGGAERRALQGWLQTTSEAAGFKLNAVLCRHTRASWWVQSGVSLVKVARWLGHSTFVCARYYAGLSDAYDPDVERGAVGRPA